MSWDARVLVVGFAGGTIEKVAMNRVRGVSLLIFQVLLKNTQIFGLHWGAYVRLILLTIGNQ